MAVEQEMAEIYPPEPEDLVEFLPETDCGDCGFSSCLEFAAALLENRTAPRKCPELDKDFGDTLASVVKLEKAAIPYNVMMEQAPCELIEMNDPGKNAPLLVTCNFRETVRIMKDILEKTRAKAFLLPVYTHGYSVDNAVHERMFKAIEIWKAMQENAVAEKMDRSVMVIPGLAESEKNAIRQLTRGCPCRAGFRFSDPAFSASKQFVHVIARENREPVFNFFNTDSNSLGANRKHRLSLQVDVSATRPHAPGMRVAPANPSK